MADELEAAGAPPELVAAEREAVGRADADAVVEVWRECWPALNLFMACATQWRTTMQGRIGLDYLAMDWVARRLDLEVGAELLGDVQELEAAALECWSEQQERAQERMRSR